MKLRHFSGIAAALSLLLAWCPPVHAEEGNVPALRVGYFSFSGYHEMSEDGRLSGYGYEFLQKLASYGDWTYEYAGYDSSYSDCLDMLSGGQLDIVTSVSKTPEREKEFLFSNKSIGTNSTMFTVKAGNDTVTAGDYATYDGLTIGLLDGNSKNDTFQAFAEEQGFSYNSRYFETEAELTKALQDGIVDGIVTGSLRATQNEWVMESISASPFYVVTRRDRQDLMDQINHAIDQMDLQEPDWRTTLHNKYYSTDSGGHVMLTAHEYAYLQEVADRKTPLKVLFNPDRSPYSYWEDGKARGILPAIFEVVAERLSLPYEYVPVTTREEYYQYLDAGSEDIILDCPEDYYLAEQKGYKISSPYLNMTLARVTRNNFHDQIRTVASVYPSDILNSYIQSHYNTVDSVDVLNYGTVDECVQAVLSGDADCTILFSYTAEKLLQNDIKNRFSFILLGDSNLSYSMGVNAEDGHILLSLINKALSGIDDGTMSDIILKETDTETMDTVQTLVAFVYANPLFGLMAVFFFCLFVFVCAVLIIRLHSQKHLQDIITLEDEIDHTEKEFQENHVQRLTRNECSPEAGMIFSDILSGLERVADHATNIAYSVLEEDQAEYASAQS